MKVLLTGASGFVGARIAETLSDVYRAPSLRTMTESEIYETVRAVSPDVIIHTAAISDIGACEKDPIASYHANVQIPLTLAESAGHAKLILFSSDQVYTGCGASLPFRETDPLRPTNTYARHKLEMERLVCAVSPDAVFLRATWMYDLPIYGLPNRSGFIMNLLRSAVTGTPVRYSSTAYRGITYVREISEQIRAFFDLPGGSYNLGSENALTMYETASQVLKIMGADPALALPDPTGNDLAMDGSKLRGFGIDFSSTVEGCRHCLKDYHLI